MNGEPLTLMTATQRESYCAWLERLVGTKRGQLPDYLRKAAEQLSQHGEYYEAR